MDLILWRHAEAEDSSPDSARKLTDKGVKQALVMAEWLKQRLPKNTRFIVSPAERTQQTAAAFSGNFETVKEIGPAAPAAAVLTAAGWPGAKNAVVVVGHQPTLGEVAASLMGGKPVLCSIRKGAIWWFTYKKKGAREEVLLKTVISPDLL